MRSQSIKVAMLLLVLVAGGVLAGSAQQQSGEEHKLSPSELKALIKTQVLPKIT
jgi:hypothetical protein